MREKYFLLRLASFFIAMHAYASIIINDRYWPMNDLNTNNEQNLVENNDDKSLFQRESRNLFSPASYISPLNDRQDLISAKRQSFGRKHHWDAFFGRRR